MRKKLLFCILALFSISLFAQREGTLSGLVITSSTRSPVDGAVITVKGENTGAYTGEDGRFIITGMKIGSHIITANMLGYESIIRENIYIRPNKVTEIIFEMNEQILETDEMTITGKFFEEKSTDAVNSVRSLNMTEVTSSAGNSWDIQRAVQSLPSVVSGTDQTNDIIVRGASPGENLFIMDQIEIDNPNHWGNPSETGGPVTMFNSLLIQKVDFFAGAFPVRYNNKISSVMDISIREGSRVKFGGNADLGMSGAGGLLEGPIGESGSYIVSYHKSFLSLVKSGFGLTAVPEYWNTQSKVVIDITNKHKLILSGLYGEDEIEIEEEEEEDEYGTDSDEYVNAGGSKYFWGIGLKNFWSPKVYTYSTLYGTNSTTDETVLKDQAPYWRDESTRNTLAFKSETFYKITPRMEISGGFQIKSEEHKNEIDYRGDTTFVYQIVGDDPNDDIKIGIHSIEDARINTQSVTSENYSAFVQAKYTFLDTWTATMGSSYNLHGTTEEQVITPRVGLSWAFSPNTTFTAAYARHSQYPDAFTISFRNWVNKDLKCRLSDHYILGAEYFPFEDVRATCEVYYKENSNIPIKESKLMPDSLDFQSTKYLSVGESYSTGIEFFLQKKMTDNLNFQLSYSYSKSMHKDYRPDPVSEFFRGDYDYRNIFSFNGSYKINMQEIDWYSEMSSSSWYDWVGWMLPFGDEIIFSSRWRYLGQRPYTEEVYDRTTHDWHKDENNELNSGLMPAYHRLDLRFDRRWYYDSINVLVYIDAQNVYNRENLWGYSYKSNGRIKEVNQFSRLVVGGFVLEF